jgi:DNA-binding IclR family transcriptional regulator
MIQSVDRCLSILEAVSRSDTGLTLAELADAMGLKPTTVHNLAGSLVARGFLGKTRRPVRYVIGPGIESLENRRAERQLRGRAAAGVRELAKRLPWATVVFTEPVGDEVVTTLRMHPARPEVVEQPSRHAMSLYRSASGLVFQAWWPDDARYAAMRRWPFDEYGSAAWHTPGELQHFLEQARGLGYAQAPDVPAGTARIAISAPVFAPAPRHELIATIGASAVLADEAERRSRTQLMIEHVTAAARKLSTGDAGEPPC